jgi:hypothetical protein
VAAGAGEDFRLQRRDTASKRVVEQLVLVPHCGPELGAFFLVGLAPVERLIRD